MGPSIVRAEPSSAAARRAMVDNQIRTFDVTDQRVLAAFETVPRELFLPARLADLAYSDAVLVVESAEGSRRSLCIPMVLARMFQGLDLSPADRVLIVGMGTGYPVAIAAELCTEVTGLETDAGFIDQAEINARALQLTGLRFTSGRLDLGDRAAAPFTAILVCGAVETRLEPLLGQLAPGGRLVVVQAASHEATPRSGKVVRFDLVGADLSSRVLFDATMPVLADFRAEPAFTF